MVACVCTVQKYSDTCQFSIRIVLKRRIIGTATYSGILRQDEIDSWKLMCDKIGDVAKLALLRDHRAKSERVVWLDVGWFEDAVCR